MRLAALYIEEHDYLFGVPQTINFGGKYFYSFAKEEGNVIVSRIENENYISGFFDLTNLETTITNVNAIVGQNGAGKSTLLDIIRSIFITNRYAMPQCNALVLVESDDDDLPRVIRSDFDQIFIEVVGEVDIRRKLPTGLTAKLQTIYYSPHYDYKFNPNFDNIDNHDISFDKLVERDLAELGEKNTNESGWPYSASQELLFKNSLRQIHFLGSNLVKEQNIFNELFPLQQHYDPILHFRGYNEKEGNWNTPSQLRPILQLVAEKTEKERSDWHLYRDSGVSEAQVHQYILKRNVLKSVLTLLNRQMERRNTFLREGYFPLSDLKEELENGDAYNAMTLFANHCAIQINKSTPINIFKESSLQLLIDAIYRAIDKADNKELISNETLKPSMDDALEILELQRNFLNELNSYYVKFYSSKEAFLVEDRDKIEGFVNYMPFSRRMSSGENSLLNFFSRIYDFLSSNLKQVKSKEPKSHYILLLDEADLNFHLSWKKKYVKALLKTLPFFFNELENKPSIEIVFTTHDPIPLSDLPNANVVYLSRGDNDSSSQVLDYSNSIRPLKTFGANISELIADSFFIENSLIGDFAFDKIQETIIWLNKKDDLERADNYKKTIKIIDEPIVQRKLAEMFDDKMETNFQLDTIEEQIRKLEELRMKLR